MVLWRFHCCHGNLIPFCFAFVHQRLRHGTDEAHVDWQAEAKVLVFCIISVERWRLAQASQVLEQICAQKFHRLEAQCFSEYLRFFTDLAPLACTIARWQYDCSCFWKNSLLRRPFTQVLFRSRSVCAENLLCIVPLICVWLWTNWKTTMSCTSVWLDTCTLYDASDSASNQMSKFQDRVLGCESYILRINSGQYTAPSGSRTWLLCRRTCCAFFEIGCRVLSHLGEFKIGIHTLSSVIKNWWSLSWRCRFHSNSLITQWLCFVWVRAEFPLAVRILFTVRIRFFSNELLQIEHLTGVLISNLYWWVP